MMLPSTGEQQKVHCETQVKIAHYLPSTVTVITVAIHTLTYAICQFHTIHSAPAHSKKRITKQIKGKEG